MSALSVVIPTYNRCSTLQKILSAYMSQTALQKVGEILVVDDGSTDSTGTVVGLVARESVVPVRYFRQRNKGPAAARNLGIREATSDLILFTDDDVIPDPTLTAAHLEWHRKFPEVSTAVLGHVAWAAEVNPTPFMKWYGSEALFAYTRLVGKIDIDYTNFYTSNLSLKTEFLRSNGTFDEDFKSAAWEDIELGFRLNNAGMRLMYNCKALAYHHVHVSFDEACRRYRRSTVARGVFEQKEAGRCHQSSMMSPLKRGLKKCLGSSLSLLKSFMDWNVPLPSSVYRTMFRIYR
jgi:glycosyltransferase involved in cell wall biosynthesis